MRKDIDDLSRDVSNQRDDVRRAILSGSIKGPAASGSSQRRHVRPAGPSPPTRKPDPSAGSRSPTFALQRRRIRPLRSGARRGPRICRYGSFVCPGPTLRLRAAVRTRLPCRRIWFAHGVAITQRDAWDPVRSVRLPPPLKLRRTTVALAKVVSRTRSRQRGSRLRLPAGGAQRSIA